MSVQNPGNATQTPQRPLHLIPERVTYAAAAAPVALAPIAAEDSGAAPATPQHDVDTGLLIMSVMPDTNVSIGGALDDASDVSSKSAMVSIFGLLPQRSNTPSSHALKIVRGWHWNPVYLGLIAVDCGSSELAVPAGHPIGNVLTASDKGFIGGIEVIEDATLGATMRVVGQDANDSGSARVVFDNHGYALLAIKVSLNGTQLTANGSRSAADGVVLNYTDF